MTNRSYWFSRARWLAFFHNTARWLDFFLPTLVVISVATAAALLVLRDRHQEPPWFWSAFGAALALAGLGALWFLRGRGLSFASALIRLEEHGRLHNRLTAAQAGVGPWPEPRRGWDAVQPRWSRVLTPGALSGGVLAAGALLPLPERESSFTPRAQPLAWSQVQSWIETLAQAKTVDPPALEKMERQLKELQEQPPEKWFQQSSLEAGDSLRSQAQQALENLQRDLQASEKVVSEAAGAGGAPAPERLKRMEENLGQALEGLQSGQLPLNRDLLKQLKDLQPGKVRQLSQEQMEQLRDRLQQGQEICARCVGPNREAGDARNATGSGGEGGGGGTAPLTFAHEQSKTGGQQTEHVQSNDLTGALPAELEAVTTGEHEVNKTGPAGPIDGGAIAGPGQGGEAVWRTSVLPAERTVLQNFFK